MSPTSALSNTHPYLRSCLTTVKESKWSDIALIISCVALLIVGIAASAGAFNAIGTTNALYLSYGMYAGAAAGAAIFLMIEIVNCLKTTSSDDHIVEDTNTKWERSAWGDAGASLHDVGPCFVNLMVIFGYIPILSIFGGGVRIYHAIISNHEPLAFRIYTLVRGVLEIIGVGLVFTLPDVILSNFVE